MADNSYRAIHVEGYKFLIFPADYLDASSAATKALLLKHGVCPDCRSTVTEFAVCNCLNEPERWQGQWSVAIADEDWATVQSALEHDRLRLKSRASARVRKVKFRDCAGFHRDEDLDAIKQIQGDTCYFCEIGIGGVRTQVDHLTSITDRGTEWPSNLAITCVPCNGTKGSKSEKEFWQGQKRKLGADFVQVLRARRASQRPLKAKLDRVRVKEVKQQVAEFETALNLALPADAKVEIELSFDEDGLAFSIGDMVLMTMPCSHRQIFRWSGEDAVNWVRPLMELSILTRSDKP
ncbi:MAG: HNH endonuclease [Pseudomonadota bacterium]